MTRLAVARWIASLVGTLALFGMLWLFGPLVPPLEDPVPRLIGGGLMLAVWASFNALIDLSRSSRDRALATGVVGNAAGEEAAAIGEKLSRALAALRTRKKGRGYLYEQPWYVIIGPPGAGKTTALLNAGLTFPLAGELGARAVAGVGGTRLCDWWFTDQAVLIDTAGRYTTQDSDAAVDRAGWEAFLDLLRRTRPRQPLNGVIVAIALNEIATGDASGHARAIGARVRELEARLGIRLPVYVLFTKADLIVGFSEYFGDLDTDGRRQVWGTTLPKGGPEAIVAGDLAGRFTALAERLQKGLFARLATEPRPEPRALIAGFPAQVASLAQPLARFIDDAFGARPIPLLRGAYFASGTQEGTPIDRLTGLLSRRFGLDQRRAATLRPEQGRSYFLADLLSKVVFGEAMLASDNPGARRRASLLRAGILAFACLVVVIAGAGLWVLRNGQLAQIDATAGALAQYEQNAAKLALDPVADADLRKLVPLLDQARALAATPAGDAVGLGLGLGQADKLGEAARTVYRHGLTQALLPRLLWRLEAQMRAALGQPEFLYEATRIYLMLGGAGPLDTASVRAWMQRDWQDTYGGADAVGLRSSLEGHLQALLADPLPAIQLDGALVGQARAQFGKVSLAERVYGRIRTSEAAAHLSPWRPSEALGAAGARLFVRGSGRPLAEGIPGLLTLDGFRRVLVPSIAPIAQAVAAEGWVLGRTTTIEPGSAEMAALQRDVLARYSADDIAAWDRLLADLDVAPFRSLTQAAQDFFILASPQSPLRRLLTGLAHEVDLPAPEGSVVSEHFRPLRDLVGDGTGGTLDPVLQALYDLQQQLAKIAAAPIGSTIAIPASNDPAILLRAQAARLPQPPQRWLLAMAAAGTALRSGDVHQQISTAWNATGGPASQCLALVRGRYPFDRSSANDLSLEDFRRLIATGGVLDGFFGSRLAPFADTSGKVWKPQSPDGGTPPVSADDIGLFQRAVALRELFFPAGAATPALRFEVTPVSLDPVSTAVTLDLDGIEIGFAHAAAVTVPVTWPGANRMQTVRLLFNPPVAAGALGDTGPWALQRLFQRARQVPAAADHTTLVFQQGDRRAAFDVHLSGPNAFAPGLFDGFRCPALP